MKWEYKVFWVSTRADLEKHLNDYGAQGWELVVAHENGLIFKRRMK